MIEGLVKMLIGIFLLVSLIWGANEIVTNFKTAFIFIALFILFSLITINGAKCLDKNINK